ncbi:MAG: phage major tail tube protein [Paracoccaceae bacterium]
MSFPRHVRDYRGYLDGFDYLGICQKATLPQPKIMTSAYRGSGMEMPAPIDMGLEAMTADMTFGEYVPRLFGLLGTHTSMTLRPGERDRYTGEARPMIFTMDGLITAPSFDGLETGKESMMKVHMEVTRLRVTVDGQLKWDLSSRPGAPRIVDGVDQLAGMRRAMGA